MTHLIEKLGFVLNLEELIFIIVVHYDQDLNPGSHAATSSGLYH